MTHFLFSILLLFFVCISGMAQTVVSGSVADKRGEALPGCTVLFIHADTVVGGVATDNRGKFQLKGLDAGDYECRVSMIGYKPATLKFRLTEKAKLPQFLLEQDSKALDEVTVSVDARELTKELAGMSIYYLTERAKKSIDVYSAFMEIPRLQVNTFERTISLIDGRTPLILIDGVKRDKYIESLSPEMIECVEIIDNPSARYRDDESVSSILNIRLKRENIKPYFSTKIHANTTPKLNDGNYGGAIETGTSSSSISIIGSFMNRSGIESDMSSDSYSGDINRFLSGKNKNTWRSTYIALSGDKVFSKKNYIAYNAKYMTNPTRNESKLDGIVTDFTNGQYSELLSEGRNSTNWNNFSADLYYKHTFSSHRKIDFTGNFTHSTNETKAYMSQRSDIYDFVNEVNLNNSLNSGKLNINYSDIIGKHMYLEIGANTRYTDFDIKDALSSDPKYNQHRIQEYVYAGIDNNTSDSKFNYMISLGLDMVFTCHDRVNNKYIDILPATSLTYKFNNRHMISVSYNRNRVLPSVGNLNPRNVSSDSLRIIIGNPFLKPSHTDNIRFDYRFNYKSISFNPYIQFYRTSDIITDYGYLKDNIYVNTFENFGHTEQLTAGTTFNYNLPFGWIGAALTYKKDYISGMPYNGNAWGYWFQLGAFYKDFTLSAYFSKDGGFNYSRYTKIKLGYTSNVELRWRASSAWEINMRLERLFYPDRAIKTTSINGDYHLYVSSVQRSLTPKFIIGVNYSFKTKNLKWRQKRYLDGADQSLGSIIAK